MAFQPKIPSADVASNITAINDSRVVRFIFYAPFCFGLPVVVGGSDRTLKW